MELKIAVLADIHANYVALQKCVDYARERDVTRFIFLGDYVGDLAYPQKTMELIYKMKEQYECYFVKGNKEDYWLDYRTYGEQGWKAYDSTTGCLLYTYQQLTERDMDFFEGMSHAQEVKFTDMPPITICHGSPKNVSEKLLPDNKKCFPAIETDKNQLILCGHSHIQGRFEHDGKTILNPGSVGVPFCSNNKTQFLLLEEKAGKWVEEFVSIDYNVERVIDDLYKAGLDKKALGWCRVSEYILKHGDVSHGSVLARAMALCEKEEGNCIWPDIPEKYWEQAVSELIKC